MSGLNLAKQTWKICEFRSQVVTWKSRLTEPGKNVRFDPGDFEKLCGLLRISELYIKLAIYALNYRKKHDSIEVFTEKQHH